MIRPKDPKPPWLKVIAPGGENFTKLKGTLRNLQLHTVCEEAHCPNVGECWREGTATVMVLGDTCTRGCRFCAVKTGNPKGVVDPDEPRNVASAIATLDLRYVVLTMVDRDDIADGGASHVAETIRRLHELSPNLLVESLVGDFRGNREHINAILDARPDVFAHNVEVVRRITRLVRDVRCTYEQSLGVLEHAKAYAPGRMTKSSVMVGAGETDDEVEECLADLRRVGVDIVTLGQYLRPGPKHLAVDRYVEPDMFARWSGKARDLGFRFVASGPLVRSSYRAAELFVRGELAGAAG